MHEFKESVRPEFVSALDAMMVASNRGQELVLGYIRRGLKLDSPVRKDPVFGRPACRV